ncbi:MAG: hypothetical protein LBO64_03635, partial [Desulfovibrio sp.]|nr:hypothetical protein [Desulfovibrio sp.]
KGVIYAPLISFRCRGFADMHRVPVALTKGHRYSSLTGQACGKPPEGRTRWTLRLLEEKTVELGIVEAISDNTFGRLLKKHCLTLKGYGVN